MAKLSESALRTLLEAERADALAAVSSSKLTQDRSRAIAYYSGDVSADIPSVQGRSTAVSSDVADTIEGLMPSLMEIFCGGDEVVRFSPVGKEDVKAAEQETDYVNHVFMQQNSGFLVLYSFIKDALLSKNGIVKVWTEEEEKEDRETYYDQPDDAFAMVAASPEVEIVEHSEHESEFAPGFKLHDFTVVARKKIKRHMVEAVPPEEFGISRRAKTIQGANYCFHEVPTTVGDLIEQGYDKAQILTLPSKDAEGNTEATARDTVDESSSTGDEGLNLYARPVIATEHYIRMDYKQDGKPALYRVKTGGTQSIVLTRGGKPDVEEVDRAPFAAMTPVIMTHRFFGRSIADLVMDIQRIKTALLRGMLDNLYLHNNPRVEVAQSHASEQTLDDLLVSRPGGVVRTKTPGGLNYQVVPDITASVYPALEYFDATREWRTGVTRQGQGIDASALQNQSATAALQGFTAAQARMKLIARIFAETGIRDLFALLHAEIRQHGDQAQTVRLRNEWVTVDPREWKERNDLTIDVGLGDGGKQQQLSNIMAVIGLQKEALAAGKTNLVQDKHLYNSAKSVVKLIGKKDAEEFFADPDAKDEQGQLVNPPPQPPQDPKVMELQMKAQLDQKADERKAQIETVQAQSDMATNQAKIQGDAQLNEQKFAFEKEIKVLEFQLKREELAMELEFKREQHQQDMRMREREHEAAMQAGAFKVAAGAEAHSQKMEQSKAKSEGAEA